MTWSCLKYVEYFQVNISIQHINFFCSTSLLVPKWIFPSWIVPNSSTSEPFTLYLHPDGFLTLSFSIAIHNICLFFFNCLPLSTRVISIRTRALSGSFIAISLRTESSSEKELNKYLLIEQVNESRFSIYCNLGKLHKSSMFQFLYLPSRKIENLTCGLYFRLNDSVSYYFSI